MLCHSKEFYAVAVDELIFTTVSGIIAVCLVGFVLIEHRSATAFVLPMILLLYVDLLGKILRFTTKRQTTFLILRSRRGLR